MADCPACGQIEQVMFRGILTEREEDLVEFKPKHRCPKCESSRVRVKRVRELQIRMKCRECGETTYVADQHAVEHASPQERRKEYDRLCSVQQSKNFSPGWVGYAYRDLFGSWPPDEWRTSA